MPNDLNPCAHATDRAQLNPLERTARRRAAAKLGWYTHATPTLFNAGTPKPQMSSCFLLQLKDDSISGIYDTLKQCAQISQSAGGIGLSIHNLRAKGSYIKGTNGTSNGIVPMLRVYNDTALYVDQGGGKRKGSFAIIISPVTARAVCSHMGSARLRMKLSIMPL